MCGIVGCIGTDDATTIVLDGLEKLEYRGYDSCGIAVVTAGETKIEKSVKRVKDLRGRIVETSPITIGHTRWATHGKVNLENAHPHRSRDEEIMAVHNGVIENYKDLRNKYLQDFNLRSQTDTEVILEVFNIFYKEEGTFLSAAKRFMKEVEGSYAMIIYHSDEPNKFYTLKNKSPLLIGQGKGFFTVSSDPLAVIEGIKKFYQQDDLSFAEVDSEEGTVKVYDDKGKQFEVKFEEINMDIEEISMEEYDSYMLKEISEQPKVMRNLIRHYEEYGISLELREVLREATKIYIVASGTSYHSGLISKRLIEKKLGIPVEVVIGSEFGYDDNIIPKGSFFIFLSQSGETADSMVVFNEVLGEYPILAVTNVRGSQMDRNADYSLHLFAGTEVAVASTKAYTAQIAMMNILISEVAGNKLIYEQLEEVAKGQEKILKDQSKLEQIAEEVKNEEELFVLGRLEDYSLSQEAALKIKEVTYINVTAYPAGELKHGTISLIEDGTKVLLLTDYKKVDKHSRSNLEEVKSRGARPYIFSNTSTEQREDDYVIEYDGVEELLPLLVIIPHQLLSYHIAKKLGLDIDKPRNLAKSVTVE